mmetsp:Transcript_10186/g.23568  ORF Transcript_10186/g.23568 Transcript_10186/m.23568 type:complete len:263 (+) Transcript_10186:448-1236(+)
MSLRCAMLAAPLRPMLGWGALQQALGCARRDPKSRPPGTAPPVRWSTGPRRPRAAPAGLAGSTGLCARGWRVGPSGPPAPRASTRRVTTCGPPPPPPSSAAGEKKRGPGNERGGASAPGAASPSPRPWAPPLPPPSLRPPRLRTKGGGWKKALVGGDPARPAAGAQGPSGWPALAAGRRRAGLGSGQPRCRTPPASTAARSGRRPLRLPLAALRGTRFQASMNSLVYLDSNFSRVQICRSWRNLHQSEMPWASSMPIKGRGL